MTTGKGEAQAAADLHAIRGFMQRLNAAKSEAEREAILEEEREGHLDPLVRGDWLPPGSEDLGDPVEYNITLSTGGPATRITGDLDVYGEATSARLEYQDWGVPWTEYRVEDDILLEYVRTVFYFGG